MPYYITAVRQLRLSLHSGFIPRFAITRVGSLTINRRPLYEAAYQNVHRTVKACGLYRPIYYNGFRQLLTAVTLEVFCVLYSIVKIQCVYQFRHKPVIVWQDSNLQILFLTQEKGFENGFVDFSLQNTNLFLVCFPTHRMLSYRIIYYRVTLILQHAPQDRIIYT